MLAGIGFFVLPVYARTAEDRDVKIEGVPYADNTFEIQLDGKVVPFTKVSNGVYQIDVKENSEFITVVQYYKRDATGQDPHPEQIYDSGGHKDLEAYPEGLKPFPKYMAVWRIGKLYEEEANAEGGHDLKEIVEVADRIDGFDNILGYVGFALKEPTSQEKLAENPDDGGLRVYLNMPKNIKNNGIKDAAGNQIYSIKEYGLLHIFSRNWNSESRDHMTVNDSMVEKIASYKAGEFDNLETTRCTATTDVFSNYLYNITEFNENKYFRGYVVIHVEGGQDIYLYGPIVGRNPYYVAQNYQNQLNNNPTYYDELMQQYVAKILNKVAASANDSVCNIIFIGDSIMLGQTVKPGATGNNKPADYTQVGTPPSKLMGDAIANRFKKSGNYDRTRCTLIANGGTTYSQPGVNRINMPDLADLATRQGYNADDVNFVFLWAGVNDWAYVRQNQVKDGNNNTAIFGCNVGGLVTNGSDPIQDPPYGDSDQSYAIGFDRTLKKVTQSFPNAKIIVCSPLRAQWPPSGDGTTTPNGATGYTLSSYSYLQKVVSGYHRTTYDEKVYFINLYDKILGDDGGMGLPDGDGAKPESTSEFTVYFPDRIHPNQEGYNKVCQIILNIMQDPNKLGLPAGSSGLIPDKNGSYIYN